MKRISLKKRKLENHIRTMGYNIERIIRMNKEKANGYPKLRGVEYFTKQIEVAKKLLKQYK